LVGWRPKKEDLPAGLSGETNASDVQDESMNRARADRLTVARMAAAVIVGALASHALAATAVRVSLSGDASFSAAELDDAVRARVPVAAPGADAAAEAIVTADGADAVVVHAGDKTQRVDLGDRRGTAAARIVALVIVDLIADELAPAVTPTQRAERSDAADTNAAAVVQAPDAPAVLVRDAMTDARAQDALRIAGTAGASRGIGAQEPFCFRADVDVSRPVAGRLVAGGALGLVLIPTRHAGQPDELSYLAGTARASFGWRANPVELTAGPFLSPYKLGGTTDHAGVLAGAGVMARLVTPLAARTQLVVAARADGYANRIHVNWQGFGGFATPRLDFGLAVGLAWDTAP
jgi:hypothetical protein